MALIVRKPKLTDRSCWLSLWQGYLSFYQAEGMSLEMTELLWKRIHTNEHPIECLVVQVEGESKLAGFVHFLPHVDTWRKQPVCYLEDLFVAEEQRGLGVGKELIQAVVRFDLFQEGQPIGIAADFHLARPGAADQRLLGFQEFGEAGEGTGPFGEGLEVRRLQFLGVEETGGGGGGMRCSGAQQ